MKKKIIILMLWIATMLFAFYAGAKIESINNEKELLNKAKETITETNAENTPDYIAEVPISDVETIAKEQKDGITRLQAETLCMDVLGDIAEETGFPISYRCIGAVAVNNKLYYVMHITWLVNNNHWSYIGNCYVSSDGQEIYDGFVSPAEYEMAELRWKK